jgi:hypothetical protein
VRGEAMLQRRPFVTPTLITDSPEARAKIKREFKEIVREAVWYLGAVEVAETLHELTVGQRGDKPDEQRNKRILAERDAASSVTQEIFARNFCQKYLGETVEAVKRQLRRLLKARRQKAEEKAQLDRWFQAALAGRGKSVVGESLSQEDKIDVLNLSSFIPIESKP